MKKFLALAAVASVAAIAAPAFADSNASIGYSNSNISNFNVGAVTGRFGWNSGPLGIEGEGSFGLKSDTNGSGASRDSASQTLVVPTLARHGFEIVDKRAGKEVYLDGSWAELFQQHIVAWQLNTPTQEEVEDTLEQYAELAQNPVVVH